MTNKPKPKIKQARIPFPAGLVPAKEEKQELKAFRLRKGAKLPVVFGRLDAVMRKELLAAYGRVLGPQSVNCNIFVTPL